MADTSRFAGGRTAKEESLERQRAAMRRALRAEYVRTQYNPHLYNNEGSAMFFDTAMARFSAMHSTMANRQQITLKSSSFFVFVFLLPGYMFYKYMDKELNRRKTSYASLEVPYDAEERRWKYFMS